MNTRRVRRPFSILLCFLAGFALFVSESRADWVAINQGLTDLEVMSLIPEPHVPSVMYAATWGGGVFRSSSGGTWWTAVNNGLADNNIHTLAVSPTLPNTLYAGTQTGGVFKSVNGGMDWNAVNTGLPGFLPQVFALTEDPGDDQVLYAGTEGEGIFKSTDGGTSWNAVNTGLTLPLTDIYALAVDPADSNVVYAGSETYGVYKSTNAGLIWTPISTAVSVTCLAVDPHDSNNVYAGTDTWGIYKSTDAGLTWNQVNTGLTDVNVHSLAADPIQPGVVYAGTDGGGVFVTSNGGALWSADNAGLPTPLVPVRTLAVDPWDASKVFAGTEGDGAFRSLGPACASEIQAVSVAASGAAADGGSGSPVVSADGRYVAFSSNAADLVAGAAGTDVYVRDMETAAVTRVSVSSAGVQGNDQSSDPDLSPDGRYVAFTSEATNLVAVDDNGHSDVFLHDRQTAVTVRVSLTDAGGQGNQASFQPSVSSDGRYVAFTSAASNLVPGDTNTKSDVFVRDLLLAQTTRVSVSSIGVQGNGACRFPSLSADGRYVAFVSEATNLVAGDTNGSADVFVHDRSTAQTVRVSVSSAGGQAGGFSEYPSLSLDGRYVVFYSNASNLTVGDANGKADVFLKDLQTGITERVSLAYDGSEGNGESRGSRRRSMSSDGRYVVFSSGSTNLLPGDTNEKWDVFVRDRQTGETSRVSASSTLGEPDGASLYPSMASDGLHMVFGSSAGNLVSGDANGQSDVFLFKTCGYPPGIAAAHSSPGYETPGTAVITCTFQVPQGRSLLSLLWRPQLPAGWTLDPVGASGDGNPQVSGGEIVFLDAFSGNPVQFTYIVNVPGGESGTHYLSAEVEYQIDGMVNPALTWANPHPLQLPEITYATASVHSSAGYPSPGTAVVACEFSYQAGLTIQSLQWTPVLPAGWTLTGVTAAAGNGNPVVLGGVVTFTPPVANNPVVFEYQVAVPGGQTGAQNIGSTIDFQLVGMALPSVDVALPDPLVLAETPIYHDADYNGPDFIIDNAEVTRVISYWNAGAYRCGAGPDGYQPGTVGATACGTHTADFQAPAWDIDGTEINRVLAYWRAGGYQPDASGVDGFAPLIPQPDVALSGPPLTPQSTPSISIEGPDTYPPGREVTFTFRASFQDPLLSILWKPLLPDGWTLESVSGTGINTVNPSKGIFWTSKVLSSPLEAVFVVHVPEGEVGEHVVDALVEYQASGMANPSTSEPDDPPILDACDPPEIVVFQGPSDPVPTGTVFQLDWVAIGGELAEISPGVGQVDPGVGVVSLEASAPETYTLVVESSCGDVQASIEVLTCDLPVIDFFSGPGGDVVAGNGAVLSWSGTGGDEAIISPGVGQVSPTGGSVAVYPSETTDYTIELRNQCGNTVNWTTVTVVPPDFDIAEFMLTVITAVKARKGRLEKNFRVSEPQ